MGRGTRDGLPSYLSLAAAALAAIDSGADRTGDPDRARMATGSTIVQFDNNDDGVIDAEIRVANVTGLTAEDFVL